MIYLASPYGHSDPFVREERYLAAAKVVLYRLLQGEAIYSPVLHCHPLVRLGKLPYGWNFWLQMDREMLQHCDRLIVLQLEGWEASLGVAKEIKLATSLSMPVEYTDEKHSYSRYKRLTNSSAPKLRPWQAE